MLSYENVYFIILFCTHRKTKDKLEKKCTKRELVSIEISFRRPVLFIICRMEAIKVCIKLIKCAYVCDAS